MTTNDGTGESWIDIPMGKIVGSDEQACYRNLASALATCDVLAQGAAPGDNHPALAAREALITLLASLADTKPSDAMLDDGNGPSSPLAAVRRAGL